MTNRHRDLSLKRSEFAWKCATKAEKKLKGSYKEYVILVKNVPTSISNNGLGQTMAFLNSKPGNKSYILLFEQLEKWLKSEIYQTSDNAENKSIIVLIQTGEVDRYRRAARETMEFITWLKLHSSSLNVETKSDADSKNQIQKT